MRKLILAALFVFLFLGLISNTTKATDQATLNQQIKEYEEQISKLQGQANTLKNQIAQFNAKINLTSLQITQTQEKISLLGTRIDLLEGSLSSLSQAFASRAVATYKMARAGETVYLLFNNESLDQTISKFHYLQKAQEADHDLLVRLQGAQNNYKKDKGEEEKLKSDLEKQKADLNSSKLAKNQLLSATQNDEKKYQDLLAKAKAELAAFRRFVSGQGGASILSNQTVCDGWGCYYNQRDSQWGNQALGNSNLSVAEYGCLISSSAMLAKHYGKNLTPGDIAANSSAFFNPDASTALFWKDVTVNGVRIVRNSVGVSTSNIDSELAAGRPVIVGLYGGPAHFIVLKSGSNGNYIMNDPFMPGGHDVSFSSKYSTNDITDVEYVSVQ